jgi:Cytochrome P460
MRWLSLLPLRALVSGRPLGGRPEADVARTIAWTSLVAALALGSVAATAVAPRLHAGDGKVVFPQNYAADVMYTTVDLPVSTPPWTTGLESTAQFRKHYATVGAIKALRNGEPIPSGSVITVVKHRAQLDTQGNPLRHDNGRFVKGDLIGFSVMEKRTGWGAEYPPEIRTGEWKFQEFTANGKPDDRVHPLACMQCHRSQAGTDFLFTFVKIKAVFAK